MPQGSRTCTHTEGVFQYAPYCFAINAKSNDNLKKKKLKSSVCVLFPAELSVARIFTFYSINLNMCLLDP